MKEIQLETDRLLLRMWREETDFETYASMCADEDIMRYIGGKTMTRVEAWRHMAFHIGHWEMRGYGHWAVEEKESGDFIGRIGFLNPVGWPAFEIGWTLDKKHWGKGFATEGARRALDVGLGGPTSGRSRALTMDVEQFRDMAAPWVRSVRIGNSGSTDGRPV